MCRVHLQAWLQREQPCRMRQQPALVNLLVTLYLFLFWGVIAPAGMAAAGAVLATGDCNPAARSEAAADPANTAAATAVGSSSSSSSAGCRIISGGAWCCCQQQRQCGPGLLQLSSSRWVGQNNMQLLYGCYVTCTTVTADVSSRVSSVLMRRALLWALRTRHTPTPQQQVNEDSFYSCFSYCHDMRHVI
jgi:hypothetical protein